MTTKVAKEPRNDETNQKHNIEAVRQAYYEGDGVDYYR
jgi:hypothetical protein